MVLHKKVCLEFGREHFTIFFPASSPCRYQYSQSTVKEKLEKKRKGCPLLSFQFIFYFSWKIPTEWVKKKKLHVSWEHAVQDFGMGTSNEVGKGVKCVSGNFEEIGNERLEIRHLRFTPPPSACARTKQGAGTAVTQNSPLRNWAERFPASVSSTITQRILVVNHRE